MISDYNALNLWFQLLTLSPRWWNTANADLCNLSILCYLSICAICAISRFVQFVGLCNLLLRVICWFVPFVDLCNLSLCAIWWFVSFVDLCNLMICVICQCRYVDMSTCGIRVCGFVIMCHSLICQYVSLPICVVNLPKCVNSVVCW